MVVKVRCPNPACGQTSRLCDDGLQRVFRCPACRTKLPFAGSPRRMRVEANSQVTGGEKLTKEWSKVRGLPTTAGEDPIAGTLEATDSGQTFRVGRLQLRDKLGSGTFATIYHAFDPLLERDVTLKV